MISRMFRAGRTPERKTGGGEWQNGLERGGGGAYCGGMKCRIHSSVRLCGPVLALAVLFGLVPAGTARGAREVVDGIAWVYEVVDGKAVLSASTVPQATKGRVAVPEKLGGVPVAAVGDYAFYDCTKIAEISLPEGIESIGEHSFQDCTALVRVELPGNVSRIGYYAFTGCTALESVALPRKVTAVGNYVFFGCTALRNVDWPPGLEKIGNSAFSHCAALETVRLPPQLLRVGEYAFAGCANLREVGLPAGLEEIGKNAFSDCTALESFELPAGVRVRKDGFARSGLRRIVVQVGTNTKIAQKAIPDGCEWLDGNGKPIEMYGLSETKRKKGGKRD